MKILLQLNGIRKSFGALNVLDNATVTLSENQKIGVIGRNGAGKSTLCKILTGHEEADAGEVAKSADLRLSYLEQHDPYSLDETVMGFLMRYSGKEGRAGTRRPAGRVWRAQSGFRAPRTPRRR